MPGPIDSQIDVGTLSMTGLGSFSTVLGTLSADDVQPIAMLQLEQLGAAFPVSGPLRAQVPDHLQRCRSTRLERLGVMVGWRKGDAASLMSHSAGGQAVALLATCLENLYGNNTTATMFYRLSRTLLPNAACLSSPKQLTQATEILSRKLGAIGFGTILAEQVCRIHREYNTLSQKAPPSLLTTLSPDDICDVLSKISRVLKEEKSFIRIRGCASMGYIAALALTLFSDDCIITVQNVIIHQAKSTVSISIEITDTFGDNSLQIQEMGKIESLSDVSVKPSQPSPTLKFAYQGHIAAYMQIHLQEWGLLCPPEVFEAMGVCILSLSDLIFISVGERHASKSQPSTIPFGQVLAEFPRATLHHRCEVALGVSLPLKWRPFAEAFTQLKRVLARSNQAENLSEATTNASRHGDPEETLFRIIDEGVASLAVHVHDKAVWQECSDREIWYPSEQAQSRGSKEIFLTPTELLYKLFSWDDANLVIKSEGTTTLVPSGILHLGNEICQTRGLELFDGLIYHDNRYHSQMFAEMDYNFWNRQINQLSLKTPPADRVYPTGEGVHSDISLAITEHVHGLALECTITAHGHRQAINIRERVDQLFGLIDAHPCRHPRKTPLHSEYVDLVQTNSVLRPDGRSGDHVSIVQTAGSPTAQFLSLTRWEPAILCRKCCLNCAYEEAREKDIYKIVVA